MGYYNRNNPTLIQDGKNRFIDRVFLAKKASCFCSAIGYLLLRLVVVAPIDNKTQFDLFIPKPFFSLGGPRVSSLPNMMDGPPERRVCFKETNEEFFYNAQTANDHTETVLFRVFVFLTLLNVFTFC
jgi:hypothetical protein